MLLLKDSPSWDGIGIKVSKSNITLCIFQTPTAKPAAKAAPKAVDSIIFGRTVKKKIIRQIFMKTAYCCCKVL